MNTLTPEMHENSNFATLISALKERLGEERIDGAQAPEPDIEPVPEPEPVALPKTTRKKKARAAKPARRTKAISGADYLDQVTNRLTRDDYKQLPDETAGELTFTKVFEKNTKYLFNTLNEFHRVVIVEDSELDEDRFIELEKEIKQYSKSLGDQRSSYTHVICLVLAESIPPSLKELIYDTKPVKYAFAEMGSCVMVVYSEEQNDIVYPKAIGENYDSKYSEKIPQYLSP
jgi:hypothetical protein